MSIKHGRCWICGEDAQLTGEHRTKRSDLKGVFGVPSQQQPLFFSDVNRKNRHVGSLDAHILKTTSGPCGKCNSNRTQPHDRAWETLSAALRARLSAIEPGGSLRATSVFPDDTSQQMLNVHLYVLKLFGGHIVDHYIDVDIHPFADAIMRGRAHPDVYLTFGHGALFAGSPMTGISNMRTASDGRDGGVACATWFHCVAPFAVRVMFARPGEPWPGLKGAWHPKLGTNKLRIADFREQPLNPLVVRHGDPGPFPE